MELEFADYLQFASLGLLDAVERFDPDRGIKFETFSFRRIIGAILNGIRSLSEQQEQIAARQQLMATRVQSLKRGANVPDDVEGLFCHLAELAIGLAIGFVLEGTGMFESADSAYTENPYSRTEVRQLQTLVRDCVGKLRDNERQVITYHYLQQIGFDEIARTLGLSRGRISQIHKAGLKSLNHHMRVSGTLNASY